MPLDGSSECCEAGKNELLEGVSSEKVCCVSAWDCWFGWRRWYGEGGGLKWLMVGS